MKKTLSVLLAVLTLLSLLSVSVSARSVYRVDGLSEDYAALMADAGDEFELGSISAKYESNGNPGAISKTVDAGGVSYGAYMFASKSGVPLAFATWCISSGEGVITGTRLVAAYELDGQKYGETFNTAWTDIASEDAQGFLRLQHSYVKAKFYDVTVDRIKQRYADFNIDSYTMALKNVIWSRAVQHGVGSSMIFNAIDKIGGTWSNHTEEELIRAIYAESACVVAKKPNDNSNAIQASSVSKYGMDAALLTGRYLRYFSLNSSDIQVSVFRRLTVNEPKDAFAMYTKYSGHLVWNTTVTPNVDLTGGSSGSDPGQNQDSTVSTIMTIFETMFTVFRLVSDFFVKMINLISSLISSMK